MECNSRRNYNKLLPHTITLDTNTRKKTVFRKNDLAIITETKPIETVETSRQIHMVAFKTVGKYKRNQEKIKRFYLEEKAKNAKAEEEKAKQARTKPLQPTTAARQNMVNRNPMGHAEVFALSRLNQKAQKRARTTRQTKQPPKLTSSTASNAPGITSRAQWLKDARNSWSKKTPLNDFNIRSKEATIRHTTVKAKDKYTNARNMLYSSPSVNKTSIDTHTLKFSPTVKVFNIPSESPGTSYEFITAASPNHFLNKDHASPSRDIGEPSWSYTIPNSAEVSQPKRIIKSTPQIDKIKSKIWKRQHPFEDTTPTQKKTSR